MSLDHDRARHLHAAANNPPTITDLRAIAAYFTRKRMLACAAAVTAAADYIEAQETAR